MDMVQALPYMRDAHPLDSAQGEIHALETIRFSISTHQGCYGECNFCAISVHQGRTIRSQSEESIINEARDFTNHSRQINLLRELRKVPKVRKAFIASGIRYDLIAEDKAHGEAYLKEILEHHISGQMKVAPEHIDDEVLALMGKAGKESLVRFKTLFDKLNPKKQFLTYYLIAAHPGCEERHMHSLKDFASKVLKMNPEQAQIFIPTPSTYSTLMYYTGRHYLTREPICVEKEMGRKERQKNIVIKKEYPSVRSRMDG